jgi:hypothetical protein
VDNSTTLGDLEFNEADLSRLANDLSERAAKITEADLKGLASPGKSWKDVRLFDIGCLVGRKVLESREAQRRRLKERK